MDVPRVVRRSALEVVAEIQPRHLARELEELLASASMLPGTLALLTARTLGADESVGRDRAVGVQLSYEGLRLTRQLIREEDRYTDENPTASYLSLVAGEVMVARGFSELAETAVAADAIGIVQRFSRNQTVDYRPGIEESGGSSLEHDVIRLAVDAGATIGREIVPPPLANCGSRLGREFDRERLPPAADVLERLRGEVGAAVPADTVMLND